MSTLLLPAASGALEPYRPGPPSPYADTAPGPFNRVAYAAAHVVVDPRADTAPWHASRIDWDATLAFRRKLWRLGFRVAEAMDTAQRGAGLSWSDTKELIRLSTAEARSLPGADLASGVGTDQLADDEVPSLAAVEAAYEEQLAFVEGCGGRAVLMASRALAKAAQGPDDYLAVYGRLISQARDKIVLHWLGDMFDPRLRGYWGTPDLDVATETVLQLIEEHAGKIDGIKISLLDRTREVELRRRLPAGVKMYTGDDFNYADLIAGDAQGHSHALLGIFDAIAPAASTALAALADGRGDAFSEILAPTVPLSRHIFQAPTQFYKAGIVFLAWLNGDQNHFAMLGGMQSARSALHYAELFRLADRARLLVDPDRAAHRIGQFMAVNGFAATGRAGRGPRSAPSVSPAVPPRPGHCAAAAAAGRG